MLDALSTTLIHTITLLAKSFCLSSLFPALCFVVVNYLLAFVAYDQTGKVALFVSEVGHGKSEETD